MEESNPLTKSEIEAIGKQLRTTFGSQETAAIADYHIPRLLAHVAHLDARIEELLKYTRHLGGCLYGWTPDGFRECSCGLRSAAIAALEGRSDG